MSPPDPRSVVRIALAFTALKHKPINQSTASYVLDLQSYFPVATERSGSRDWRSYALELEKQLTTLKAQHDANQESSTSNAPPPKKKSKKGPTKDQHDPEWSWDQSRADWQRFLSSQYSSSPSLVAAHASLRGALSSPNTDPLSYASRLTDAILRALVTISLFLFSSANPSSESHSQIALGIPQQLQPALTDSTRIAMASPLLVYILRTVLPALVRTAQDSIKSKRRQRQQTTTLASGDVHAQVDKALDHVLECVLLPLLRALAPLCSARLAPLVSAPLRKDKANRPVGKCRDKDVRAGSALLDSQKSDVRTDVLTVIGTSLEVLDALPPLVRPSGPSASAGGAGASSIASGIRDRLGLETIRELEALYAVSRAPHPSVGTPPISLQLFPRQPAATSTEPQPLQPAPNPTPTQSEPQLQLQSRTQQRAATEPRAKLLERLAGTRAERVRALATRDAGWFLASTLNLCVTPGTDHSGGLLREAFLDRIGKLVRSVHVPLSGLVSDTTVDQRPSHPSDAVEDRPIADDSKVVIDPVCRNMLLAICERAMSHLIPS